MKKKLATFTTAAVLTLGVSIGSGSSPAYAGDCTPFDGGGYIHFICGKVYNRAARSVAVSKGTPSTFYKWVSPGGYAGSDGYNQPGVDIDGFRIPIGCYARWNYTGPAPTRYADTSAGRWMKITDLTVVTITSITC